MNHELIIAPFPCPCGGGLVLNYKGKLEYAKCLSCHKVSWHIGVKKILKMEKIMTDLALIDLNSIIPDYSEAYAGKIQPGAWKSLKEDAILHFNKSVRCWNGYKATGNEGLLEIMKEEREASAASLRPITAILSDEDYSKMLNAVDLLLELSKVFCL